MYPRSASRILQRLSGITLLRFLHIAAPHIQRYDIVQIYYSVVTNARTTENAETKNYVNW